MTFTDIIKYWYGLHYVLSTVRSFEPAKKGSHELNQAYWCIGLQRIVPLFIVTNHWLRFKFWHGFCLCICWRSSSADPSPLGGSVNNSISKLCQSALSWLTVIIPEGTENSITTNKSQYIQNPNFGKTKNYSMTSSIKWIYLEHMQK